MSRTDKVFARTMSGQADNAISFDELCHLLRRLGFAERVSGSHHVFKKPNVPAIVLQADAAHAKSYQVRQVRQIFRQYNIKL
jgi:predicted RNA binding protein YcfA (HicA-like mRNA interferase family)